MSDVLKEMTALAADLVRGAETRTGVPRLSICASASTTPPVAKAFGATLYLLL